MTIVPNPWITGLLMLPLGAGYTAVIALFNATLQLMLPAWVRARGLAIYIVAFHAALAAGSVAWGVLANGIGINAALAVSGGSVLVFIPLFRWLAFPSADIIDSGPLVGWTEPQLRLDIRGQEGPVTVTTIYHVPDEHRAEFVRTMIGVAGARRRTGALRHELLQEGSSTDTFIETYVVPSWAEYIRQQAQRLTPADRELERRARAFAEQAGAERHWFLPDGPVAARQVRDVSE